LIDESLDSALNKAAAKYQQILVLKMRMKTLAALVVITFLAVSTVYANAQMYSSGSLYNRDSPANNPFKERMQDEMNRLLRIQANYDKGQITWEQYRLDMEEYSRAMVEVHRQYLSSSIGGLMW
jgi:hypothetical protein